ncbi:hypothetical protein WJX72_000538 [[Myrmecia] bisecta]|uniref:Heterogeneous nuclear ribonucleoprotein Q acidic domain-containing protein n=1 Tax=[Myrmecia] bisecta TaxID=41462 RepID=A0AAW1PVY3_9CHLO
MSQQHLPGPPPIPGTTLAVAPRKRRGWDVVDPSAADQAPSSSQAILTPCPPGPPNGLNGAAAVAVARIQEILRSGRKSPGGEAAGDGGKASSKADAKSSQRKSAAEREDSSRSPDKRRRGRRRSRDLRSSSSDSSSSRSPKRRTSERKGSGRRTRRSWSPSQRPRRSFSPGFRGGPPFRGAGFGGPPPFRGGPRPPPALLDQDDRPVTLTAPVRERLGALFQRGVLRPGILDGPCLENLALLTEAEALAALADLARANLSRIRNVSAFFVGIIRRTAADGGTTLPPSGVPKRRPGPVGVDRRGFNESAAPPFAVRQQARERQSSGSPVARRRRAAGMAAAADTHMQGTVTAAPPAPAPAQQSVAAAGGESNPLRQAITEYVKEVLKPAWKAKRLSRDAFKLVAKKTVDKVMSALPSEGVQVGDNAAAAAAYLNDLRRDKIKRLVGSYVAKYEGQ